MATAESVTTAVVQEWSENLAENLPIVSIESNTTANETSDTVTGTTCLGLAMLAKCSNIDIIRTIAKLLCYISLSGACLI